MARRPMLSLGLVAVLVLWACDDNAQTRRIVEGRWGGDDIQIEVVGGKTLIRLACADGQIDGLIRLDDDGRFSVTGTIALGPVVRESAEAIYEGQVVGDTLTVTIRLLDTDEELGTFAAVFDREVVLIQCR